MSDREKLENALLVIEQRARQVADTCVGANDSEGDSIAALARAIDSLDKVRADIRRDRNWPEPQSLRA